MRKWQYKLHSIIYEADTPAGKLFDVLLLITILLSVLFVALESVDFIDDEYHIFLDSAEWIFTIIFTIEYFIRIICVRRPFSYIFSFYGIIDLISVVPKYISILTIGNHSLLALKTRSEEHTSELQSQD